MAKKQLKKLNQPKKYLQGGSNMGSVSQMKQTPYYLGQVQANAAKDELEASSNALYKTRMQELENKRVAEEQVKQQNDQFAKTSAQSLLDAGKTDQRTGDLGRFFRRGAPGITPGVTKMTEVAATNALPYSYNAGAVVAPTASTAGLQTISTAASPATQMIVGQAAPTMSTLGQTVTGSANVADVGAAASTATKAGLSSAATAGIGIGLTAAGMITERKTSDKTDFYNNQRERRGNVTGEALKGAGTGATIGSLILPGVGTAIGAGIGAGVGALKGRKENKANTELAEDLQRQSASQRGAYQSAFINSRLTGQDTGFGLNSSTNMNNQFTNQYQVAKTGGVKKVPGGQIVPIEGTDAVEFKGRSHENGGVTIDKNTEVEGGETMDQVAMNDNNKQDYIFSKYLKLGGKSFAQRHKEILKGSGSQAEIQQLAAMQEKVAGRDSQQVAAYGGFHKYEEGGFTDPPSTDWKNSAADLIRKKESFTAIATWDENAYRAGYGSDQVLRNGKLITITKGMTVTKEEAENTLLNYSVNHYSARIIKDLGEENWNKLNDNQRTALFSLGYNAGPAFISRYSYGRKIKANIEKGDFEAAANVIRNEGPTHGKRSGYMPGLKKRRVEEANLFNSESTQPANQSSTQPVQKPEPVKKTLLPPPPVSSRVATLAERNNLPGIGSMQMNEELQMPEQTPSAPFDPTMTRQERLEKENQSPVTFVNADDPTKRPDGIQLFQDPKTKEYIYRDGEGNEIIRGKNRNRLENQMSALQPGFSGFDTQLAEAEAPVRRQDLSGVKPNITANTQAPADTQTVIAQQNGTSNAPAMAAYNAPARVQPAGSPPPPVASATNGGPGTAPTINNQNTAFQYTAKTPGYLDYSDPNTAGGVWSGDNYEKQWKPLVGSTMSDATKADQVIDYLTNYTGTDAADVKAKIAGKSRAEQIAIINDLATDTKVGPFHNAVYGAIQSTTKPPVAPPVVPPVTPPTTTETPTGELPKAIEPCPPGNYRSQDGSCQPVPAFKQRNGISGSMLAGFGQLIPMGAALANPYKIAPGIAGAPSVKGALMPRMNLNQERASSIQNNVAYKNAVVNQNAGPGALAVLQGANAALNDQMLKIAKQEQTANTQLAAEEGKLGMQASMFNAETGMKRDMFNAELSKDERRYSREDTLSALDAAARGVAGIVKDERAYKADERYANAVDGTGSYTRFTTLEQLQKEARRKNSPFYGKTESELRRMSAAMYKELNPEGYVGKSEYTKLQEENAKLQKEKEEAAKNGQVKFGGARQYVSRLGQLSGVRGTKAKL
jgi:GH24 family phage-related lysozyme (muramidase)